MALFHFPKNDNNWGSNTSSTQANTLVHPPEQWSKISIYKVRKVTHEHKFFQFICQNILICNTYCTNYTLQKLRLARKKPLPLHHSNVKLHLFGRIVHRYITHVPFTFHMIFLQSPHVAMRVHTKHTNACFIHFKYWLEDKNDMHIAAHQGMGTNLTRGVPNSQLQDMQVLQGHSYGSINMLTDPFRLCHYSKNQSPETHRTPKEIKDK